MQIPKLYQLLCIGVMLVIFSSCKKTNTQGKLIPGDAGIVMMVDGKSLSSKLPWDEVKQNPLFRKIYADSGFPATMRSLLDNPENAGIDIKNDLLFFAIKDSTGGYVGFEGMVKDENKFSAFNQQMIENGKASEKDGVRFFSKAPVSVGWTKEKFVYVFDTPQMSKIDDVDLSKGLNTDNTETGNSYTRDIEATCKGIFGLKESNSLATNEKFGQLMKETGDVHFWVNTEELSKGSSSSAALSMFNLEKFYKGNVTTATMNFDNGKMSVNAKTYAGEEMTNLFKKYSGGKINEEMIRRMPGKDMIAVMALNFKPEGIRELIKMTGLDGLINLGVEKLGFSMDDFIKANKGDIFFGISDLVLKSDTAGSKPTDTAGIKTFSQKSTFNFIFSASIGEKEAFNKLVNAGKKMGTGLLGDSSKMPVSFKFNETYFVMSNSQQNVDQYLGTASADFDFINKINGEPFGGYLDIQSLIKAMGSQAIKDSSAKIAFDASVNMWDKVLWKGGKFSEGGMIQSLEINLVDKTTNSLRQLNQYAAKLSGLYKD